MVILLDSINCIYGYHGSPYSDAGLAIKTGKYEGGASDDQVLFGYTSFKDAIAGRNIERRIAGGYGRFITELKCPYDKIIIFDENAEANPLVWNLPPSLKKPSEISIYCKNNSSKTKHIWGGAWKGGLVLFRKDVLPRVVSREMDQFEEKWYPIGTLPQKYPEETLSGVTLGKKRSVGVQVGHSTKGINPKELSYEGRVDYWQSKLGKNLSKMDLASLKYSPEYVPK
jgi:hypothetical protein